MIHQWTNGWCIVSVEGGVDGLNVDYGERDFHEDCSLGELRTGKLPTNTCMFKREDYSGDDSSPFAAIDAAWDSPRDNVAYKVTEVPR